MVYQIKMTEEAERDSRRINDYIGEYNAKRILEKIKNDIKKLRSMPYAHKTLYSFSDLNGEYRRMLSNGYAIIYQVIGNQITILRIFSNK